MNALYRLGEGSVADVLALVPEDMTYDSVRLTLGALGEKGHLTHRREGRRYIYQPVVPHLKASRSAVRQLLSTYFRESPSEAILALLDVSSGRLSEAEIDEIEAWVREAKEGR
jgi:predicted transcriptional regulator